MKIYFVRHGQTDWNLEGRLQGRADIELNEKVISQAGIAKEKLKDKKFDLIICSPLKRAQKTAEIINQGRNIPVIYDERILERNFGELEGSYKAEIDWEEFWNYNMKTDKAETVIELCKRVNDFIDEISSKYKDKNILVVAHGGVGLSFECYFKGIPEDGNLLKLLMENCEVREYEL